MTELLSYVIACIIGSVISIGIVVFCLMILAKWDKESKELLEDGDVE